MKIYKGNYDTNYAYEEYKKDKAAGTAFLAAFKMTYKQHKLKFSKKNFERMKNTMAVIASMLGEYIEIKDEDEKLSS